MDIEILARLLGDQVKSHVQAALSPINNRMKAVELSVEAMEKLPVIHPDELKRVNDQLAQHRETVAQTATDLEKSLTELSNSMRETLAKSSQSLSEPAFISAVAAEVVSLMPAPEKGEKGDSVDMDQLAKEIEKRIPTAHQIVSEPHVWEQLKEVAEDRVKSAFEAYPKPKDGEDGKSVDMDQLAQDIASHIPSIRDIVASDDFKAAANESITAAVAEAVAALPPAQKGEDGKDVDMDVVISLMNDALPTVDKVVSDPELINTLGEMVAAGVSKAIDLIEKPKDGAPGEKGEPGKDGEDGRDAAQLEILPAIDVEKSVPRGTYATHNGGLWRSFEKTNGMKGWECLVDGIATTEVTSTGERTITLKITRSSGEVEEKNLDLHAVIYRKIFKAGMTYEKGDMVTYAGSLWHCDSTTDKRPDEAVDCWTLAAKRGRDGKSGEKGDEGKPGRAGKDLTQSPHNMRTS